MIASSLQVGGGRPRRTDAVAASVDLSAAIFDFPAPVALRKSYIVASAPGTGGTLLCAKLWQTGALGAPAEYLTYPTGAVADGIAKRLQASSFADYLAKLIACRTSKNGVFGAKVYFKEFMDILGRCPELLNVLAPSYFIYLDCEDKLGRAAAMAEAVQVDASAPAPRYDRDLISKCLGLLDRDRLGWMRWFEANGVVPLIVNYEDLVVAPGRVVDAVARFLGIEDDAPDTPRHLPPLSGSAEVGNKAWASRFARETRAGIAHVFDRYDEIAGVEAASRPRERASMARRRRRCDAIIGHHRALFRNSRVLVIRSGVGRWCLAALDAGATYVLGLEVGTGLADTAAAILSKDGVQASSYSLVETTDVFTTLATLSPDTFDVVLCTDFSGLSDPYLCLRHLRRLRPKTVLLDTDVIEAREAIVRFEARPARGPLPSEPARPSAALVAVPSHELIRLLCDHFGFRMQPFDWHDLGIVDWTGIRDYESGRRRTYLLDRRKFPGPDVPARGS